MDQGLITFDLTLASDNYRLAAQNFTSQLSRFTDRLFVLLVNGSFLPARQHNDKVEFADAFLCRRFGLVFSEGFQERIMLVFLALVHKFKCVGLLSNHPTHILVREHCTARLSQTSLHSFVVLLQLFSLLLLDHAPHFLFKNLNGLLVVEIVSLECIVFFLQVRRLLLHLLTLTLCVHD